MPLLPWNFLGPFQKFRRGGRWSVVGGPAFSESPTRKACRSKKRGSAVGDCDNRRPTKRPVVPKSGRRLWSVIGFAGERELSRGSFIEYWQRARLFCRMAVSSVCFTLCLTVSLVRVCGSFRHRATRAFSGTNVCCSTTSVSSNASNAAHIS